MIINKKPKKKRPMSRFLVPFIVVSIFSFTAVAVYVQLKTNIELSPTLITCFYGFTGSELAMLASIKKTKVKNNYNNNDEEAQG